MPIDDIPTSLQESILAALIFDERHGAVIAGQVSAQIFDEGYREIAEKVLDYRRKYRKAPGRAHLDDLFGKLLQQGRASRMRRTIFDLAELADDINGEYLVSRTEEYVRQQRYKAALVEANSRFEQGGDGLADDIEGVFTKAIRARSATMEAGTFLNDMKRGFKFFDRPSNGISFGIEALDSVGFLLAPGEQTLYIAPKNTGKTWFCVNTGISAILQNKRVAHLSLEMQEPEITARYYQRAFAVGRDMETFNKSYLDFDQLGRMTGWRTRRVTPNWSFASSGAQKMLRQKMRPWGTRFGNLVIKHFPSGSLTLALLEGYLDYLEIEEKFVPHVLVVDYPDLMSIDSKNLRIDTGRTFVGLRGVAGRRNLALVTPTQSDRTTIGAQYTSSRNTTEDISKVFTADQVLTYQQTPAEYELGLGRLKVEHARVTRVGAMIVITQSYATGQYALQSAIMNQNYWDKLRDTTGGRDDDDTGRNRARNEDRQGPRRRSSTSSRRTDDSD